MDTAQFVAARRDLSDRLAAALRALFLGLGSWRDVDLAAFVEQAVPAVEGTQQALAQLTAIYVADQASSVFGGRIAPTELDTLALASLRAGVTPDEVYARPFVTVRTALSKGKTLDEAVELGAQRLEQIAEMDLQQTYAHASREAMRRLPPSRRPRFWQRVLQGEENCALCVVASTQRYTVETLNPIHPGCVPGTAMVRARNISAATRRWYAGELAVITTARGDQVAVTPKHPVLTDHGWVAADAVRPGHHVVGSGGRQRVVGNGPDERDVPVLAEQVWRALAVTFDFVRVPLAAEDFHGDGSDGEVDVVRADGYFSTERNLQTAGEGLFMPGHVGRPELAPAGDSAPLVPAGRAASDSRVRGSSLSRPLLRGHLCGPHRAGLRWAAAWDAGLGEPALHNGARDPLLVGDRVLGESPLDVVDAELFDRVVDVGRVGFTGHVYNFQCRSGTYEAYTHIVHNCDCTVDAIWTRNDPGQVIAPDRLEQVHAAVEEMTGTRDSGARAPDYRKLMTRMVDRHGELGDLLVRPGDTFTGPADIP